MSPLAGRRGSTTKLTSLAGKAFGGNSLLVASNEWPDQLAVTVPVQPVGTVQLNAREELPVPVKVQSLAAVTVILLQKFPLGAFAPLIIWPLIACPGSTVKRYSADTGDTGVVAAWAGVKGTCR